MKFILLLHVQFKMKNQEVARILELYYSIAIYIIKTKDEMVTFLRSEDNVKPTRPTYCHNK